MKRALSLTALVALVSCGNPDIVTEAPHGEWAEDGSALKGDEVKVAVSGMTVWLRTSATQELRDDRAVWIVRGRTSVNLESAFSYVPDDGFGEAKVLSPRTFEVALQSVYSGELNTLLSGFPLFVRLVQPGGKNATLRFVLEPRFVDITGSAQLWLTAALKPIYVNDAGLTYRGKLRAASLGTVTGAKVSTRAGTQDEWNLDFTYDAVVAAASGSGVEVMVGDQTKHANLKLAVAGLEIDRTEDAYERWPTLTCTAAVQACLNAAGAQAPDYEACGSYRQVDRCNVPSRLPQLGLAPEDPSKIKAVLATLSQPVTVSTYFVQASSSVRPALAQVVKAWQRQDAVAAGTTWMADLTPGQVNTALDAYGARALVPAIQQTVRQQSFKAQKLTDGTASYVVLYFTAAARFAVIRLP